MNILSVIGSKNKDSITSKLMKDIAQELNKMYTVNWEQIHLKDYIILDCEGCSTCFKTGRCQLQNKDNMEAIINKIQKVDIVFFASPVYVNNVSGVMKSFIDRLCLDCHLLKFAGKFGYTLTTASNSGSEYVSEYLKNVQISLGMKNLANFIWIDLEKKNQNDFTHYVAQQILYEYKLNYGYSSIELEESFFRWRKYFRNYGAYYERKYWNSNFVNNCEDFFEYACEIRKKNKLNLVKDDFSVDKNNIIKVEQGDILNKREYKFAINVIENYLRVCLTGKLRPLFASDFLLVLTEVYPYIKEKEIWDDIGYRLCHDIKESIERNGVSEQFLGIISGLGFQTFIVQRYSEETGHLQGFFRSLLKTFLQISSTKAANYLIQKKQTNAKDYDLVYGLSGNLYYLLDFQWSKSEKKEIEIIIQYLIYLTENHYYNDRLVINLHISCEEQFREDEKISFPNGNLNFGVAHGMVGPLVSLCKAYNVGYRVKGIEDAIKKLFNIYDIFKRYDNGIPIWPTQLKYEDFIENKFNGDIRENRAGWCYGNIGIARGLIKAASYMNDKKSELIYQDDLKKILLQPWPNFHLNSSILCHGYASVLAIINSLKWDDSEFIRTVTEGIDKIIVEYESKSDKFFDEMDMSFLQGVAGIALTMLSFIKPDAKFYKLLMLD